MRSIKEKAISGVKWTSAAALVSTVLQVLQWVVLARILGPEDFGLMAITLLVIRFGTPMMEIGLSQAIIQSGSVSRRQSSTLYWLNVSLGMIVCSGAFLLSTPIATFFGEPAVGALIRLISIAFLIVPWGTQFGAFFAKELRFDLITKISVSSIALEFVVSIALAMAGFGVLALVIGYLSRVVLLTCCNIYFGWNAHRPQLLFTFEESRTMIRFGAFEAANQLTNALNANLDKAIIGKVLGAGPLGLYTLAKDIVTVPNAKINPIITRVAFPVFSKIKDQVGAINRYYSKAIALLMMINLPALIGLSLVAHEFLYVVYGAQWLGAEDALVILAFVGILKAFASPGGSVLLAKGRSDIGFYWNIVWIIALSIFLTAFVLIDQSIEAAAWAMLAASLALGWLWHYSIHRVGAIQYRPILMHLLKLTLLCLPMTIGVKAVSYLPVESVVLVLGLKIALGVFLYISAIYLGNRNVFDDLRSTKNLN